MKTILRKLADNALAPVWTVAFWTLPVSVVSYVVGLRYGYKTTGSQTVLKWTGRLVGSNFKRAPDILNARIARLSAEKRRRACAAVWQAPTTAAWGDDLYENTEGRSRQYVYQAIKALKRPVSILELGCSTGGSLRCLQYLGVEVTSYVDVDISERAIKKARARNQKGEFVHSDFNEYLRSSNRHFDVLLVNLTFMFLEQPYLEELAGLLNVERIVISEKEIRNQGRHSAIGNWGNSPLDYSHDYESIFLENGYRVESGGLVPFYLHDGANEQPPERLRNAMLFEAVLRRP